MRRNGKNPRILRNFILIIYLVWLIFSPVHLTHAASLTVNSLGDTSDGSCSSGHCTLREAIIAANGTSGADTIGFNLSGTITLGSQLPAVNSSGGALTIDGVGRTVYINGNDSVRVFYVNTSANLTLRNLRIEHGFAGGDSHGGAIYNLGSLTLEDCLLNNNRAYNLGGGIYNSGLLSLVDTGFTGNTTDVGSGGAIYNAYSKLITADGGYFYSNYAGFAGGAVYNTGHLEVQGTVFNFNEAVGNNGGAIYNSHELIASSATFSLNNADIYGGALANDVGGDFEIVDCTLSLNTAGSKGGAIYVHEIYVYGRVYRSWLYYNNSLEGGGIYIRRGPVTLNGTLLEHNEAESDGGGIYNSDGYVISHHSTFESNSAGTDGGGIYTIDSMSVDHNTFESNSAGNDGGGIWSVALGVTQTIENSTFYGNSADKGGGMYLMYIANLTNDTFFSNSAVTSGGALYATSSAHVKNSILANSSIANCGTSSSLPANYGNNIDSGSSCGWGSTNGSQSSTNPLLGALQNNGGITKTMMPQAGSPAVNAVIYNSPNGCPGDDQRGYARPFGAYCEIGAVERVFVVFLPLAVR